MESENILYILNPKLKFEELRVIRMWYDIIYKQPLEEIYLIFIQNLKHNVFIRNKNQIKFSNHHKKTQKTFQLNHNFLY